MNKNAKEMGYKIDFVKRTITITRAFAENANTLNSKEFKLLGEVLEQFPNFQVIGRTHKSPKKPNAYKGLTYKTMKDYISVYENANEYLEQFNKVKIASKTQANGYKFVRDWFVSEFPNYKETPKFINGKLFAIVNTEDEKAIA